MKTFPYFGVGGKGRIGEDEDLKLIENAKILGALLVKAVEEQP